MRTTTALMTTIFLVAGCGGDTDGPTGPCGATVSPSDDDQTAVQAALINAQPGSMVCLAEGRFTFQAELSLDVDGVTVRGEGADKTVLDFSGQIVGANGFLVTSDGVSIEDLKVEDPAGDGIRATAVEGIAFRRVTVEWTTENDTEAGAYGIYPVRSKDVLVQDCKVLGASDAGIYVGQSNNALVVGNEVSRNVAGIEIENTTTAEVRDNLATDNAGGILIFNLPGLVKKDGKETKVHHNTVVENNRANFAKAGNVVALVPSGTGILLLAADASEIHDNVIKDNSTIGVTVIDYTEFIFNKWDDDEFDPHAESNYIHHNTLENIGYDPKGMVGATGLFPVPFPYLAWDGCFDPEKDNADGHLTNCFFENGDVSYADVDICGELQATFDAAPVTCQGKTLEPVDLE